jgi:hypothetical protein
MKIRFLFLSALVFLMIGCQFQTKPSTTSGTKPESSSAPKNDNAADRSNKNENVTPAPEKSQPGDNAACYSLKRAGLVLDKKQTFAIDFKPFEKSCFVTFHDPEFDNPPLGSQFFVYKNGKEVFNFPEQFGGSNTTCRVDAVGFEDLNNDQLKDIIVAGKCGGKSDEYNENMVYLNTGKDFVTKAGANAETMDFSKINQIRDFVKKNPNMFSK